MTWGLNGKVSACVHDNARNIVAANSPGRVNWDSVPCFAHTLQLAVNDGFNVFVHRVIVAAGRLVRHFNHSTPACKALEAKQVKCNFRNTSSFSRVKQDGTRYVACSEDFLNKGGLLQRFFHDRTVTKLQDARTLEIRDEYWQIMTEITPVLETLKCATTIMSTEKNVSISNIYPITFSLLNTHLMRAEDDGHRVTEFKAKVRQSLSDRMEVDADELVAKPALIASYLDPRHKHLPFLAKQQKEAKLTEMCASLAMATTEDEQAVSKDAAAQAGDEQRSKSNAMLLLLADNYSAPREITDCPEEVDIYMRDSPPSLDDRMKPASRD
ncbi:putative zinc finger BED domain-containing protein 1-like [Triplophysa rosa]|uniref:Zinc finger BED domain-containing protein 1-like n=1 Tax=Triplophysa rosa TaxID=992332 RepID=A0A9W7TSH2_TRIRA|nr:putative zinc finger BED domain-containing protein 1-like [Triplophysa rosa]